MLCRNSFSDAGFFYIAGRQYFAKFAADGALLWRQEGADLDIDPLHAIVTRLPLDVFRDQTVTRSIQDAYSDLPFHARRWFNVVREFIAHTIQNIANLVLEKRFRTPSLEQISEAFAKSSAALVALAVDPANRISREELGLLEAFPTQSESKVLCVLGSPGSGKTALLALLAKNALDAGICVLGIKADLLPTETALETWGRRELGVDMTALEAVKAAASQSKVLVIVDQLDALASTVDLKSGRLNAVIEFIDQCSKLSGVSVVCSCRNFDYDHDVRFAALSPQTIQLQLPKWEDVVPLLARHGVENYSEWPESFRELLRTPQHLQIYLKRFHATIPSHQFCNC